MNPMSPFSFSVGWLFSGCFSRGLDPLGPPLSAPPLAHASSPGGGLFSSLLSLVRLARLPSLWLSGSLCRSPLSCSLGQWTIPTAFRRLRGSDEIWSSYVLLQYDVH